MGERTYSVDERVFDVIDTPEKAYWLGFFAADGCNQSDEKTLALALSVEDEEHVRKFRSFLSSEHPISYTEKYTELGTYCRYARVCIHSKYLAARLTELGMPPVKTFNLIFPDYLNNHLLHYWILGFFDGDGGISVYKEQTYMTGRAYFIGLDTVIFKLRNILKEAGFHFTMTRDEDRHERIYSISRGGAHQALKFLHWLYRDVDVGLVLPRKYRLYRQLETIQKEKLSKPFNHSRKWEDVELIKEIGRMYFDEKVMMKDIAKIYDTTYWTISSYLSKYKRITLDCVENGSLTQKRRLTDADIASIRDILLREPKLSNAAIADRIGTSEATISRKRKKLNL